MLTPRELADLAGVAPADLRSVLSGSRVLPGASVARLADGLGVEVEAVVGLGPDRLELPGQREATPTARAVALRLAHLWPHLRRGGVREARALAVIAWALAVYARDEQPADDDVVLALEPLTLGERRLEVGARTTVRELGAGLRALAAVGAVVVVPREVAR